MLLKLEVIREMLVDAHQKSANSEFDCLTITKFGKNLVIIAKIVKIIQDCTMFHDIPKTQIDFK